MDSPLQLAQHYCASVITEPIPINQLVQLSPLMDRSSTIQRTSTPPRLPTPPVIYRTDDGQVAVLNPRQIIDDLDHVRFHPQTDIQVSRLTAQDDVAVARIFYQVIGLAKRFGEIDPLLHAAYSHNHLTALLNQVFLLQPPYQPITTEQIVQLCRARVQKSTINHRKSVLGYTDSSRGCKARAATLTDEASNDEQHDHAAIWRE